MENKRKADARVDRVELCRWLAAVPRAPLRRWARRAQDRLQLLRLRLALAREAVAAADVAAPQLGRQPSLLHRNSDAEPLHHLVPARAAVRGVLDRRDCPS